ncbi:hypothetical protein JOQ06_028451 [Pogonophryne albipinna]|uniref:Ig-like domain-containing protein n=1 Tax=Pogonophryne albipinna TaxID=1090488 RepID=A0AAD6B916_9TELE|nr:hypothetical protein JOQ06_028451 [Pogonophryne albipinna]
MAAVSELSVLLFALISNIHAEELIVIQKENDSLTFELLPDLQICCTANTSTYMIQNLTRSDSGLYQEECWTEGQVTHEKHITITVCISTHRIRYEYQNVGNTIDLPCRGAADHLDVQWLKRDKRSEQGTWTRVFGDDTASVMDNDRGRYQVVTKTSALRISNISTTELNVYTCLLMDQQQCVGSHPAQFLLNTEWMYRSVGDTVVLQCPVTDLSEEEPPSWTTTFYNGDQVQQNFTRSSGDQNYSLVLTSVTLNHSELFSEGEEVTLRCKDWEKGQSPLWFFKSNRTKGRTFIVNPKLNQSDVRKYPDGRLGISNLSLQDTGEYWCAVADGEQCLFSSKTVLKHRDPFGVHSTFYAVRCSALSVLLLMLCVAVSL